MDSNSLVAVRLRVWDLSAASETRSPIAIGVNIIMLNTIMLSSIYFSHRPHLYWRLCPSKSLRMNLAPCRSRRFYLYNSGVIYFTMRRPRPHRSFSTNSATLSKSSNRKKHRPSAMATNASPGTTVVQLAGMELKLPSALLKYTRSSPQLWR